MTTSDTHQIRGNHLRGINGTANYTKNTGDRRGWSGDGAGGVISDLAGNKEDVGFRSFRHTFSCRESLASLALGNSRFLFPFPIFRRLSGCICGSIQSSSNSDFKLLVHHYYCSAEMEIFPAQFYTHALLDQHSSNKGIANETADRLSSEVCSRTGWLRNLFISE